MRTRSYNPAVTRAALPSPASLPRATAFAPVGPSSLPLPQHGALARGMSPLTLAAVALTASGRVQLLPGEVEFKLLDKVDVEFPDGTGGLAGDAAAKFVVRTCGEAQSTALALNACRARRPACCP